MRRYPFPRLLFAAALVLVLSVPAPAVFAAPAETPPVLTHLADWLTSLFDRLPGPPAHRGDTQETTPTLDPDGLSEAPSPTLTNSQTDGGEGEGLPTLDPDG